MAANIAIYKYEEAKEFVQRMPWAHLAFILLLLPWMFPDWTVNGHVLICLLSGVTVGLITNLFDINQRLNQSLLLVSYGILLIIEFLGLGLLTVDVGINGSPLSKGILFELLVEMLPWLYFTARIFFIYPFINFIVRGRHLRSAKMAGSI